jgi:hypothetical protein
MELESVRPRGDLPGTETQGLGHSLLAKKKNMLYFDAVNPAREFP